MKKATIQDALKQGQSMSTQIELEHKHEDRVYAGFLFLLFLGIALMMIMA